MFALIIIGNHILLLPVAHRSGNTSNSGERGGGGGGEAAYIYKFTQEWIFKLIFYCLEAPTFVVITI